MKIAEKILWGLFIFLMISALTYGLLIGLPSTIPAIAMKSEKITEQKLRADLTDEQMQEFNEMLKPSSSGTGGTATRRPQTEVYRINKPLLERLGNIAECQRELMSASSNVLEDGSLKVFDIQTGSLLERVGLRENDVLKSINGLPLDFSSLGEVMDSHGESLEKLRNGNPVVIQIERRGTAKALVIDPTGI